MNNVYLPDRKITSKFLDNELEQFKTALNEGMILGAAVPKNVTDNLFINTWNPGDWKRYELVYRHDPWCSGESVVHPAWFTRVATNREMYEMITHYRSMHAIAGVSNHFVRSTERRKCGCWAAWLNPLQ